MILARFRPTKLHQFCTSILQFFCNYQILGSVMVVSFLIPFCWRYCQPCSENHDFPYNIQLYKPINHQQPLKQEETCSLHYYPSAPLLGLYRLLASTILTPLFLPITQTSGKQRLGIASRLGFGLGRPLRFHWYEATS